MPPGMVEHRVLASEGRQRCKKIHTKLLEIGRRKTWKYVIKAERPSIVTHQRLVCMQEVPLKILIYVLFPVKKFGFSCLSCHFPCQVLSLSMII
jgi:hypothetical protein